MKVLVMGGGCIGGSIAIKLYEEKHDVVVVDPNVDIVIALNKIGVPAFSEKLETFFDILILALPMRIEETVLRNIRTDAILIDVSSVMTPFVRIAEERNLKFVGGHPMAGNEKKGKDGWNPDMFKKRTFFLSKSKYIDDETIFIAENIVLDLGGVPIWIDPIEHDRIVSKISHTTYLLSLSAKIIGKDYEKFAGPGYESTTRLSKQNMDMALDILFYNRKNILEDVEHVLKILSRMKEYIKYGKFEKLELFIREVIG